MMKEAPLLVLVILLYILLSDNVITGLLFIQKHLLGYHSDASYMTYRIQHILSLFFRFTTSANT